MQEWPSSRRSRVAAEVTCHYARINNPGTRQVNVTLAVEPKDTTLDLALATYLGRTAAPATPAERAACTGDVVDVSAASYSESVTLTIPAGGRAILLTTNVDPGVTGQIRLGVTTNFVGIEQTPPVDTDVTLSATRGASVTAAVSFATTQTLPVLDATVGCPSTGGNNTSYRYIRVNNPTASARTADLSLASGNDTVIAWYDAGTPPVNSARLKCADVNDTCVGIASADSCVRGITVPARGSVIVYAAKFAAGAGSTTFKATTTN